MWEGGKWVQPDKLEIQGQFKFSMKWHDEDIRKDFPDLARNAEEVRKLMCDIDNDLEFTMEIGGSCTADS